MIEPTAPWHRESFDRFLNERLPELLAERLPLVGYQAVSTGTYTCRVSVTVGKGDNSAEATFEELPQPDQDGLFVVDGRPTVVVPRVGEGDLAEAPVRCCGELLYEYVAEHLGEAPEHLPWDDGLLRSWLPLDAWWRDLLGALPYAQALDDLNWLSRRTHLRRLIYDGAARSGEQRRLFTPGHFGRVCPFETPEGPNIGYVIHVARGASIKQGRLVVLDDTPTARLGLTAAMIPFIDHNDANRVLMGANMMRQCHLAEEPEPALVRTGFEPDEPGFWYGRNLLTAFVSWGIGTYEDGILVSESCAERLDFPHELEPGDKLSNRHGTKGTVSSIVPDDEMPHLSDGTPVELAFSFLGCHTRLNHGQILEAVWSRVAREEGEPVLAPLGGSPSTADLRRRLARAGLPESGMETLTRGRDGPPLERPSTVGWVYWGRLDHLARNKLHAVTGTPSDRRLRGQRQGERENYALFAVGAYAISAEFLHLLDSARPDTDSLAARVAAGVVELPPPPTAKFADLARRLGAVGITAELQGEKLTFRFADPAGPTLELARPVPHPWLPERELSVLGALPELAEYQAVQRANERVARLAESAAPESLTREAVDALAERVAQLCRVLITKEHVVLGGRLLFSGRTVLGAAHDLRPDQVGLADELAWTLYGPQVARELGDEAAVRERTDQAAQVLDRVMADSWLLVNRAPTLELTNILALRPVRQPDRVIRLHPLVCPLMNADFDGDQAAVILPLTEAGQRQAGERLSLAAHLRRDPDVVDLVCLWIDAMYGIARLSLEPAGRGEIAEILGVEVATPDGFATRTTLRQAARTVLERDGAEAVLERLDRLMRRGFEVTKRSGASISPFIGRSITPPPQPEDDDVRAWEVYAASVGERIAARRDYDDEDLGPQLLAFKSEARGSLEQLLPLVVGSRATGPVRDVNGRRVPIRNGLVEGLSAEEMWACVVGAREGLACTVTDLAEASGPQWIRASQPRGFNVLSRAMRARQQAGVVFAHAAAIRETDPLTDPRSRLFVGLPVARHNITDYTGV